MAITISQAAGTVGQAAKSPSLSGGAKPIIDRYYQIDFDSSYPTGGESISTIFDDFKEVLCITVEPRGSRLFEIDYTADAEKIKLYTAVGTEATNASNQSTITDVRLRVSGY